MLPETNAKDPDLQGSLVSWIRIRESAIHRSGSKVQKYLPKKLRQNQILISRAESEPLKKRNL